MSDEDLNKIGNLIDSKLDSKLEVTERRILAEVGKFVEDQILPAIDQKADKSDIDRLERKIDRITEVFSIN